MRRRRKEPQNQETLADVVDEAWGSTGVWLWDKICRFFRWVVSLFRKNEPQPEPEPNESEVV